MRILHVVGDSGFGGAARGIVALATQWTENKWEADLLATDPAFQQFAKKNGVNVVPLNCIWRQVNPIKDLWGALKLYLFLRQRHYDVVHTHTTKAGFVGRICARLARVPVIVHTVHGFAFHETSPTRKIRFYSLLEKLAVRCCTHVVTVSHFHRQWLIDLGIASGERVTAIPNGVSPNSNSDAMPGATQEDAAATIVCIGRLAHEKGLEDLIDAASLLKNRIGARFVIDIVGDGLLRNELERRCARAGVTDCVRFSGFQTDVRAVLRSSDIVIQPSIREGMSISLLEGMAEGKPIIATSISSNVEATGGGRAALLVPPHCPGQLALAMQTLLSDPEYARTIAAHARVRFESHYTLQRMLDEYMALYDRICAQDALELHRPLIGGIVALRNRIARLRDILVVSALLLALSPVLLVCALAVRCSSPGPILFRQRRLGLHGRPFLLLKFRSMQHEAPDLRNADGSAYVGKNDLRVTRTGRFLRQTSLDELPQLFNVLRGDMSLVGPRPDQVDQVRFYTETERHKLLVKPGITGLAQIGGRNNISWERRKALDVEYVLRQSLRLDLSILARTIPYVFLRKDINSDDHQTSYRPTARH